MNNLQLEIRAIYNNATSKFSIFLEIKIEVLRKHEAYLLQTWKTAQPSRLGFAIRRATADTDCERKA